MYAHRMMWKVQAILPMLPPSAKWLFAISDEDGQPSDVPTYASLDVVVPSEDLLDLVGRPFWALERPWDTEYSDAEGPVYMTVNGGLEITVSGE